MATTEFVSNNKIHIVAKLSLFKINYKQKFWNKKKEKVCKSGEVCERNDKEAERDKSSVDKIIEENKKICR